MDLEYLDNARVACNGVRNDKANANNHLRTAAMELYNAYMELHGGLTPSSYQYRALIDIRVTEADTDELISIIKNLVNKMDAPVTYDEQSNNVLECIDPNGRL
jgi:hypothetical protein